MGLFNQFPFTNFHEMNLDWLLQKMSEIEKAANPQSIYETITKEVNKYTESPEFKAELDAGIDKYCSDINQQITDVEKRLDNIRVYNIIDFGADPTGNLDSSAAIQQAVNQALTKESYGIVYAPSGQYRIDSTITIKTIIGCTILGARKSPSWANNGTTFVYTGGGNAFDITNTDENNIYQYNIVIKDIAISCTQNCNAAIAIANIQESLLEGILVYSSTNARINYGIYARSTSITEYRDIVISTNVDIGIYIAESSGNCDIHDCNIYNTRVGIQLSSFPFGIHIHDNWIEGFSVAILVRTVNKDVFINNLSIDNNLMLQTKAVSEVAHYVYFQPTGTYAMRFTANISNNVFYRGANQTIDCNIAAERPDGAVMEPMLFFGHNKFYNCVSSPIILSPADLWFPFVSLLGNEAYTGLMPGPYARILDCNVRCMRIGNSGLLNNSGCTIVLTPYQYGTITMFFENSSTLNISGHEITITKNGNGVETFAFETTASNQLNVSWSGGSYSTQVNNNAIAIGCTGKAIITIY